MDTMNREAATQAAEAGASMAAAHADRVCPSWSERALARLKAYAEARPTSAFFAEDVRMAAELDGLPPPPDRRAWGFVVRCAKLAGFIVHAGYARQKAVNCHGSPKSMWRLSA